MLTQVSPVKFTYADFLLFPDDGRRHELLEGEHYVSPSPRTKHQKVSWNLAGLFDRFLTRHPLGEMFCAPYDVVLSDEDVVETDLVYVSAARAAIITEANVQGAPDLVVEILSESSGKADEITKRKLYERCGILEYWIVDPESEGVKVYRLVDGRYVRAAELSHKAGDRLTSDLFPGLSLPLAEVFEGCRRGM